MAEDKIDGRETTWRQLLPWTELFRGFQVAFDLNKMLLAAAGILVMAFGWWLLAVIFGATFANTPPGWPEQRLAKYGDDKQKAWIEFRRTFEDHDPGPAVGVEVERELGTQVDEARVGRGHDDGGIIRILIFQQRHRLETQHRRQQHIKSPSAQAGAGRLIVGLRPGNEYGHALTLTIPLEDSSCRLRPPTSEW